MVRFDDLKSSLTAHMMRLGRVTHQDLLNWASANKVGYLMLYLMLRDIIKDKQWRTSGEYVLASFRVNNEELKLVIPMYIETTRPQKTAVRTERERKQRRVKGANILDIITVDEKKKNVTNNEHEEIPKVPEQTVEQTVNEVKVVQEIKGGEEVGGGNEQVIDAVKEVNMDVSSMEAENFMRVLRNAVNHEFIGNTDLAYKVALSMLNYLGKYWSVGELRLKIDIAKQVVGRVDDDIIRIEDGVLRILRRMGIIEIVEPGVINRVKDLPKDFVKLKLDYMIDKP